MSLYSFTDKLDLCVVGQGLCACAAALCGARHGLTTLLLTDGPIVLPETLATGKGSFARETGLLEEWLLAARKNGARGDCLPLSTLMTTLEKEPNLTVMEATHVSLLWEDGQISAARYDGGTVTALFYADCSEEALLSYEGSLPLGRVDVLPSQDFTDAVAYTAAGEELLLIPYRCLYLPSVKNLFFAAQHTAAAALFGDGTRTALGQAIGTAAAVAKKHGVTPAGVYASHLLELLETLQYDDCFLPYRARTVSEGARDALLSCDDTVSGDILHLRSGLDRSHPTYGEGDQGFVVNPGGALEYQMDTPALVTRVRIVFDSDLDRPADSALMPPSLGRAFALEVESEGEWEGVLFETDNSRRLLTASICRPVTGIRLSLLSTWGEATVRLFSFDFE